jgi:hypothetical protein
MFPATRKKLHKGLTGKSYSCITYMLVKINISCDSVQERRATEEIMEAAQKEALYV